MSHSSGAGINMSKLIEPLSGFLRKKEATTWTGIRIHHKPPPNSFPDKMYKSCGQKVVHNIFCTKSCRKKVVQKVVQNVVDKSCTKKVVKHV